MVKHIHFDQLEQLLNYRFKDRKYLRLALTHSSAAHGSDKLENNERLEFLGDRVLGLVIAELLNERFPIAAEGELARRYNRLVRKETCAIIAKDLNLGHHMVMGEGEKESGGRDKPTILADACEAVLGALFLDGGYDAARLIIRTLWSPKLLNADNVPTDPKSALQEWAQGRGLALPKYIEVKRHGPDHAPEFTTEVQIEGIEPARGNGSSKRTAEQAAAREMLIREKIWNASEDV